MSKTSLGMLKRKPAWLLEPWWSCTPHTVGLRLTPSQMLPKSHHYNRGRVSEGGPLASLFEIAWFRLGGPRKTL